MALRTEVLGDGEPGVAVVYCVHGDEPCGKEAADRLRDSDLEFRESVKLVMANEEAYRRGEKFIDADLNRCFGAGGDGHEHRLAERLLEELEGLKVLDLHSTKSRPTPFSIVVGANSRNLDIVRSTGVARTVDMSIVSGSLIEQVDGAAVECGYQGSPAAADNAYDVVLEFLASNDVIGRKANPAEPALYEAYDRVQGEGYRFSGDNFRKVEKGEVYAVNGGSSKRAEESFYPVLMSTDGYGFKGMMGFKARKL
ncbi:MAG: succinylglutamate desuccinylase/aspartoacylase family protein [Candidatus Nanohaloarchaea archaeon]